MSDKLCPCGCGLSYAQAVREVMRTSLLNEDQAEAAIDAAARARDGGGR